MRPRRIRRGRGAFCSSLCTVTRYGFNEAAANSPRKVAGLVELLAHQPGFNEAAANSPRKAPLRQTAGSRATSRFNEAAANSPRKVLPSPAVFAERFALQ